MKYTQFKPFEKHLLAARPHNFSGLYCLIIKDGSERALAVDELKNALATSYPALDYRVYNLDHKAEKSLLDDLMMPSLFQNHRLVHFQGAEKLSKDSMQGLERYFNKLPSSLTLLFSAETLNKLTLFYKALEKYGVVLDIGNEKSWEKEKMLAEWLLQRADAAGKSITTDAVNMLVRGVSHNLALLASEWEKILTYVGQQKQITAADLNAIGVLLSADSTWLLGEAILQNNAKKALEAAHNSLLQGGSAIALLRGLRHQFTTALYVATYANRGTLDEVTVKFPYLRGAPLDKQIALSTSYGPQRLAKGLQLIDEYEFKAKDQCDDPELLLNLLIGRLT